MKRRVIISGPARRDLRRLTPAVAARVLDAISRFTETGLGDVIRLHGSPIEYRLRVGDWRIRFRIGDEDDVIEIIRVLPRGRAYRD